MGSLVAWGVKVDKLYVADVFVTSQDEKQLKAGAKAGLLQVLVRVSGNDLLAQNPVIRSALKTPQSYYYQFSYQATDREFQIGDEIVSAKILRLHFQPNAIAELLREAALPIWDSNRPGVLVWIVMDDGEGRYLASESESNELISAVNTYAVTRGIPLLYPLLDLEDSSQLSAAEVWGSFKTRIDKASVRYNPDSILTARLQKREDGRWSASWSYRIDQRWYNGQHLSFSGDEIAKTMVDDLANALAARYAFDARRTELELVVEDISSVQDYAGVTQYLNALAPVIDSQVVEVRGTKVIFRLIMQGSSDQLAGLIKLEEKMLLLSPVNRLNKLNYQWID